MNFGICKLSLVPVRREPSDKSEQITQLVFGECYEVLLTQEKWFQIRNVADGYEGWIDFKQHFPVSDAYFQEWKEGKHARSMDIVQTVSSSNCVTPIGLGSLLPFFDGMSIRVGEERMLYNGRATNPALPYRENFLQKMALQFMRAPYVWGGKSIFGIDCSGFVQQVYGLCGYQLRRDAYQQVEHGQEVHFVAQTRPGDVAFFDNEEGRIIHVGIVLEDQKIIHASGEVRIDQLDHHGIYNRDRKRYSHKLRIIKRILPD
ncbi:C40 family peptidase [Rufibacter immobilis]|uniref:C40 family peptidase n=1 Tax=Rufibacter immobilis TaxID=1348778 RepID=UPI001FE81FBD|nr:C40 family peptidase [Rufibacter immobilis]